jgi:spermidine/putrescine transport system ATP-binding protein
VGIRPEKIRIGLPDVIMTGNSLHGGIVSDVSFVGVSTQYVVEMPWKQDLMVFEQNDGGSPTLRAGDPVSLSWSPPFTFGLDGSEDVNAGSELEGDH